MHNGSSPRHPRHPLPAIPSRQRSCSDQRSAVRRADIGRCRPSSATDDRRLRVHGAAELGCRPGDASDQRHRGTGNHIAIPEKIKKETRHCAETPTKERQREKRSVDVIDTGTFRGPPPAIAGGGGSRCRSHNHNGLSVAGLSERPPGLPPHLLRFTAAQQTVWKIRRRSSPDRPDGRHRFSRTHCRDAS
jgi:hypothetical protein